jgi:hypothetical protein
MLNVTSSRSSHRHDPFGLLPKSRNSDRAPLFLPPKSEPRSQPRNRPGRNREDEEVEPSFAINSSPKTSRSSRRFTIQFVSLYGTPLDKEMDSMMLSFKFFTKSTPDVIIERSYPNRNNNKSMPSRAPDLYILFDREPLRDSTQVLKALPDQVIIDDLHCNSADPKDPCRVDNARVFRNVVMVYISASPGNRECTGANRVNTVFPELPMYYVEYNTNKRIKFCPDNDRVVQEIIERLKSQPRAQNRNGNRPNRSKNFSQSRSRSASILTESKLSKMGVPNTKIEENVPNMSTKSIALSKINDLYYSLRQKSPANSLYIDREKVTNLFKTSFYKSLQVQPQLFERIARGGLCPNFVFENRQILYVDVTQTPSLTITQESMREYGSGFTEYYQMKKSEFQSNRMKKYLIALDYIQNLQHRNGGLLKRSSLFPVQRNGQEISEFQNAFYLGFDVEYLYTHRLKEEIRKGCKKFTYILPLVAKYPGSGNGNGRERYILYYLLFSHSQVYLYEIVNMIGDDRSLVDKVNEKMDQYMAYIFSSSFLAAKPFHLKYMGMVRRDPRLDLKLPFLSENLLTQLYAHLHLFNALINPGIRLCKEILGEGNGPTNQMTLFITYLLEMGRGNGNVNRINQNNLK